MVQSEKVMQVDRPRSGGIRVLGWIGYLLICALCLATGALAGWVNQSDVVRALIGQEVANRDPVEVFAKDHLTLLVLGCDEDRQYGGKVLRSQARSDMMMVARLDFQNHTISGISIPRDILYKLEGYRAHKINAYHALGGKELAQEAVESMLELDIDRTVVLDYEAFQRMIDIAGGVEVEVEKPLKYTDKAGDLYIDIPAGLNQLDGYQAMGYVRFRHDDNDFKRQDRQKQVVVALKNQLEKNWTVLPKVTNEAVALLDHAFKPDEIAALARFAKGVPVTSIRMASVPVKPGRRYNLLVDREKLPDTLAELNLTGPATVSAL